MILIDTSIWADHFGKAIASLAQLVARDEVLQHPFVTGELALGNPTDRNALIAMLDALPQAHVSEWRELLEFAGTHDLGGTGIDYVDAHLLAAAQLHKAELWTRDKRLANQAERLGLAYAPL